MFLDNTLSKGQETVKGVFCISEQIKGVIIVQEDSDRKEKHA